MSADFLILGEGYTGTSLRSLLLKNYPQAQVHGTRRQNAKINFELEREDTWKNLPESKNILWMFAGEDKEMARRLFRQKFRNSQVVVVSTTSHFLFEDDSEVNEQTPIDLQLPRAQAEEALREEGAVILHAAGIYGVNRNPLDWYRKGRIADLNKYLNLIHVDDLAQALLLAVQRGQKSQRFIAADSHPQLWLEIVKRWIDPEIKVEGGHRKGKRVNSQWSISTLGLNLKYPNIHDGIAALQ